VSSAIPESWDIQALSGIPCRFLRSWLDESTLLEQSSFPTAKKLTELLRRTHPDIAHKFIKQNLNEPQNDYYENVIAYKQQIPTRADNWHDFLNAMVWMKFPLAKTKISELHARDIAAHGLVPRTPRRDRLTHFDECGVLLLIKQADINDVQPFIRALSTHQWNDVFIRYESFWNRAVKPCLFGHATMEMLLSPFIGLTAKWLAIVVDDDFDEMTNAQQREHIDLQLALTLEKNQGFTSKDVLRPLPILGIPGWTSNQNDEFYRNTDYFRAQRKGVALSEQYPLTGLLENDKHKP
jgi:hypothetical protein